MFLEDTGTTIVIKAIDFVNDTMTTFATVFTTLEQAAEYWRNIGHVVVIGDSGMTAVIINKA